MRFAFPPYGLLGLGSRQMAAGSDEALRLVPARQFGLEQAKEFINQG